ncbi:MAG: glycosyltransferase, partial [Bacteroidia bacterium]|nr:glycosyltransferase [Bacteroidia bacterium]
MKVALVHDWFSANGGSEKVVAQFIDMFDDIDVFALVDFFTEEDRFVILQGKRAHTTFIQKLPFAKSNYRSYLPLFPIAIEQFDFTGYDLVISSSSAIAKGVLTKVGQPHVCYCHTPMRYAWDFYHLYLEQNGLKGMGLKSYFVRRSLHNIRMWDYASSQRVDHFIANSNYIAKRIEKTYGRKAKVIYPPVATNTFKLVEKKEDFYLTVCRLVPYKKVEIIAEAFSVMPNKTLIIIGEGPELNRIKRFKGKNIQILGYQPQEKLNWYMENAKAFIFAAEEDFGIAPIEAQACGTPVIAFQSGGTLETVVDGVTGCFFDEQTPQSLVSAIDELESRYDS